MNQVSKYSIQVLCFTIIILIVALVSSYFTASHKDKQQLKALQEYRKMLQKEEEYAQKKINQLHNQIYELEKAKKLDSIHINRLEHKIQQDEVKMEKERKEATKMNSDEKRDYLLLRYN